MSFFGRVFGGATADEERQSADRSYRAANYYEARLSYEKALDKNKGANPELETHCRGRIRECYDGLAIQRLEEAERFRRDGELQLARTELNSALELAQGAEIKNRAILAIERLERKDAVDNAREVGELSDDERWSLIATSWEEAQLSEYDAYGEALRTALLALHDEEPEIAQPILEKLADSHDDAVFLYADVGRARLLAEDEDGAIEAFSLFLSRVDEDDESDTRLAAHIQLAMIYDRRQDEERALEWLQTAVTAMSGDPRPYLQLGAYMRRRGYSEEAIEVLDTAIELMEESRPAWDVQQELGLAYRDAGRDARAIELLEQVIAFFVGRGQVDFPATTALPLARLYETAGKLERAADLYRGLANGSDRANHLLYHREAARVLIELELFAEARRMLTRASALAEDEADELAAIRRDLESLAEKLR